MAIIQPHRGEVFKYKVLLLYSVSVLYLTLQLLTFTRHICAQMFVLCASYVGKHAMIQILRKVIILSVAVVA